jgi:predicted porin
VAHRPFNDLGRQTLFGATFATTAANVITDDKIAGIGAYYDVGPVRVLSRYTTTESTAVASQRSERLNTFSVGAVRIPNVLGLRPGIGVNYSSLGDSKWVPVYGILGYYLSKRTDVYLRVVSQGASGPAGQVATNFLEGPSSTG